MEAHLKQWALFAHKFQKEMKLCREVEFPDSILRTMSTEGSYYSGSYDL
jgi:hypothetical protein